MLPIGLRYRYLREKAGLTQEVVANELFLSRTYYGKIESGKANPIESIVEKLKVILNTSKEYLENHSPNQELSLQLNRIFQSLLEDKPEIVLEQNILSFPITNLFQEVSARLLLVAAYYAQRNFDEAEVIENEYLSFFLPKIKLKKLPLDFQNIYQLYVYHKSSFHGEYPTSLDACNFLCNATNQNIKQIFYFKKVDVYLSQGNYSQAATSLEKAFKLIGKESGSHLLAQGYVYQSAIYIYFKMYDFCLEYLDSLEDNIEANGLNEHRVALAQHRGFIYSEKRDFPKALKFYEKALILPSTTKRRITLYNCLVHISLETKDYIKAQNYIHSAQKLDLSEYDKIVFSSYEAEISLVEGDEKKFMKSKLLAIKYFEENKCFINLEHDYSILSDYYLRKKNTRQAFIYLKKKENLTYEKH